MRSYAYRWLIPTFILCAAPLWADTEPVPYMVPMIDQETGVITGHVVRVCTSYTLLSVSSAEQYEMKGWYVVEGSCCLSKGAVVIGNTHIILKNNSDLNIGAPGAGFAALQVHGPKGISVTVYAQSADAQKMGRLTAVGKGAPGIGSNGVLSGESIPNAPITINGGRVTATATAGLTFGRGGAGIGGGYRCDGENIAINGGVVHAIGAGYKSDSAAGIGGGCQGRGRGICIRGGTVVASGAAGSAGIGGGKQADGYDIHITGGIVTASGGADGAGIGGGDHGSGREIHIRGGRVKACGGKHAAGIGGGCEGHGCDIEIGAGYVEAKGLGTGGPGIGGGAQSGSASNIRISGGTVIASGADGSVHDIGGGEYGTSKGLLITGGNVVASRMGCQPKNLAGANVYAVVVPFVQQAPTVVTGLENYGVIDLYPHEGDLIFYLPNGWRYFIAGKTSYSVSVSGQKTRAAMKSASD